MVDSCLRDKSLTELEKEQRNLITKRNEINFRLNKILRKGKSNQMGDTHKYSHLLIIRQSNIQGDTSYLIKRKRSSSAYTEGEDEESELNPYITSVINEIIGV